jgi:dihydrofolate reductase
MTVEVFIATSMDGYIARPDGAIDWLENPDYVIEGEDYGHAAFMANVSCMLMGSGTFKVVSEFEDWPYKVPVYVLSHSLERLPQSLEGKAFLRSGPLEETIAELLKTYDGTVYLDGGKLIQSGLRAGHVDRMCITRIPVLLGEGLPLFGPLSADIALEHVETTSFSSGLTQSTYEVKPPQIQTDR